MSRWLRASQSLSPSTSSQTVVTHKLQFCDDTADRGAVGIMQPTLPRPALAALRHASRRVLHEPYSFCCSQASNTRLSHAATAHGLATDASKRGRDPSPTLCHALEDKCSQSCPSPASDRSTYPSTQRLKRVATGSGSACFSVTVVLMQRRRSSSAALCNRKRLMGGELHSGKELPDEHLNKVCTSEILPNATHARRLFRVIKAASPQPSPQADACTPPPSQEAAACF